MAQGLDETGFILVLQYNIIGFCGNILWISVVAQGLDEAGFILVLQYIIITRIVVCALVGRTPAARSLCGFGLRGVKGGALPALWWFCIALPSSSNSCSSSSSRSSRSTSSGSSVGL